MHLISYIECVSFTGKVYLNFGKICGKYFKVNVVHYPIVGTIRISRQPLRDTGVTNSITYTKHGIKVLQDKVSKDEAVCTGGVRIKRKEILKSIREQERRRTLKTSV